MEEERKQFIENGKVVTEVIGSWEAVTKDADGNAHIHTLHKHSRKERPDVGSLIQPVEVCRLKFDRKRAARIGAKTLLVFGDTQIGFRRIADEMVPLHDVPAMQAVHQLARNLQPDVLVDLGDDIDLAELSRFAPDSRHFQNTLQPSLQANHDWHAELSEATPKAERHLVDSNHSKRFNDYILKNAGVLAEIPELKLNRLLRLEEIGWEFHGGYGSAEYEYADDLAFMHGVFATANGSTAAKLSQANRDRHIFQGHAHRTEAQWSTDRKGRSFGAFVVGALCRIDGVVPSYHSAVDQHDQPVKHYENWQQSVAVIRDYGDSQYTFDQVPIHNGVLHFEGKRYGNT